MSLQALRTDCYQNKLHMEVSFREFSISFLNFLPTRLIQKTHIQVMKELRLGKNNGQWV